uniref:Uncharacterized protein n=1 Tax=Labrus bergylta TaxID=56723 RepID=A0A3Q3GSN9_9LABR
MMQVWRNEFVSWDPEQCGSSWITIPRNLLWVPDVVINELVVSSCRLDIYTFPFDIQNCTLSFNSYLHTSKNSSEWQLVGITVKTYIYPTTLEILTKRFVSVRRQATLYVVNLLIPSCFLITVDLFSFVLPPKSVDRSLFKMTLILGYTVFLFTFINIVLDVFLSLCLTMMVASLLETILITNLLCGSAHYRPVPRFVRVLVLQILGRLVLLSPKPRALEDRVIQNPAAGGRMTGLRCGFTGNIIHVDINKRALSCPAGAEESGKGSPGLHLQLKQQLDGNQGSEDWIQVGFIIDRLLFGLYILFILVSFITMTVIWLGLHSFQVRHKK